MIRNKERRMRILFLFFLTFFGLKFPKGQPKGKEERSYPKKVNHMRERSNPSSLIIALMKTPWVTTKILSESVRSDHGSTYEEVT